jgi:hypothetical protein
MAGAPHRGLLAAALFCSGCFSPGQGVEPPLSRLYFPVGLALNRAPRTDCNGVEVSVQRPATRLYVANSDFDLQFNGGALQAYDLERLRRLIPRECSADEDCLAGESCDLEPTAANGNAPSHWCVSASGEPCGAFGEKGSASRWIQPGRCGFVDPNQPQDGSPPLIVASVGIGAFATDVIYRSRPPDADCNERAGGRLFVPVRGDATLHFIESDDDTKTARTGFELDCGQDRNHGDCDQTHRAGANADESPRALRMPPEPYALDATPDGRAVAVTHQTQGAVSLFVNDWDAGDLRPPVLEFVLGGLPTAAMNVASIPEPALVSESPARGSPVDYQPGFLVTFANAPFIKLLRYFADSPHADPSNPSRPFLVDSGTVTVSANSGSFDSRGVGLDPTERRACEASCPATPWEGDDPLSARRPCLSRCAAVQLGVYVGDRTPNSLLVGATQPNASVTSSDDMPRFYDSIPMPIGVSRVVVGNIIDLDGQARRRIFAISFDQRRVSIYDPEARVVEKWIETGRGPHALVIDQDPARSFSWGYLGHFTDSYLAVVDLDRRHAHYGQIVLTLSAATPPRTSK